jgi:hypothetical protein
MGAKLKCGLSMDAVQGTRLADWFRTRGGVSAQKVIDAMSDAFRTELGIAEKPLSPGAFGSPGCKRHNRILASGEVHQIDRVASCCFDGRLIDA